MHILIEVNAWSHWNKIKDGTTNEPKKKDEEDGPKHDA